MTHVSVETLIDHVRGLGSPALRASVSHHLSACEACAEAAAVFEHVDGSDEDLSANPPEDVVDAAIALFSRRATGAADRARLVFDSATGSPDDPDADGECARLLRYESRDGAIELEVLIVKERTRVLVAGQVTARDGRQVSGAVIAHRPAESAEGAIARARTSDRGEFRLEYVPPAAALLHFILADASGPIDVLIEADSRAGAVDPR